MRFVSRAEWGAQYRPAFDEIPGPRRGVTLHWEGPPMGYPWPHRRCARKVRAIERFHKVFRGWAGIAYNLLVCPHGYVFEGRGAGIRSAANGTSSIGGNDSWQAVCYIGGVGDPLTPAGRTGLVDAVVYLRRRGNAGRAVNGHCDHHPTECPGDRIYQWLQRADFTPSEEDEMTKAEREELVDDIAREVTQRLLGTEVPVVRGDQVKDSPLRNMFRELEEGQDRTRELVRELVDHFNREETTQS